MTYYIILFKSLEFIINFFSRHGAEVVEKGASTSRGSAVFKGTGYRLGQSESDNQGKSLSPHMILFIQITV